MKNTDFKIDLKNSLKFKFSSKNSVIFVIIDYFLSIDDLFERAYTSFLKFKETLKQFKASFNIRCNDLN